MIPLVDQDEPIATLKVDKDDILTIIVRDVGNRVSSDKVGVKGVKIHDKDDGPSWMINLQSFGMVVNKTRKYPADVKVLESIMTVQDEDTLELLLKNI